MRSFVRLVMSVALLALPARVHAQVACGDRSARPLSADEATTKLDVLNTRDCLGGTACPTPLCAQFTAWHAARTPAGAVELLTAIRNSAAASGTGDNMRRLVERLDAWIAVVGADAVAKHAPGQWRYDAGSGTLFGGTVSEIKIDETVRRRCASNAAECGAAFAEAVEIQTDATLVERMNGAMLTPLREALVTYVAALDQRWTDYFNRAPAQFPWELALNGALYRRQERRGYNEPPTSQWIVAHPTVAYEYVRNEGDAFKSAIALEAVGYFTRGVGASLAAVWADRATGNDVGYGVTLHWRGKLTIGAIAHPGAARRVAVLVSPDLEKLIAANGKRIRQALTLVRARPGM